MVIFYFVYYTMRRLDVPLCTISVIMIAVFHND